MPDGNSTRGEQSLSRSRAGQAIARALAAATGCALLLFWPAGDLLWAPGWLLLGVSSVLFSASAAILARVNPEILRARSGLATGTVAWDKALLAAILPSMAAVLVVSALDAGRYHWSRPDAWTCWVGYALVAGAIALQTWAQAVNPFFEQGVRVQTERKQRVIDTGPYRFVRHPGYASAAALLAGAALALGSLWGLVPAALSFSLLVVRTALEDRLLRSGLTGYEEYAGRTRFRLFPGIW